MACLPGKKFLGFFAKRVASPQGMGDYSDPSSDSAVLSDSGGQGFCVVAARSLSTPAREKESEGVLTFSLQLGKYMGCR